LFGLNVSGLAGQVAVRLAQGVGLAVLLAEVVEEVRLRGLVSPLMPCLQL
jgi:hypothetical protein